MAAYPVPGRWLLTHKNKSSPAGNACGAAFCCQVRASLMRKGQAKRATATPCRRFCRHFYRRFLGHIAKNRRRSDKICKGEFAEDDGNVLKIRINAEKHRTSKECSVNSYGGGEGNRTPEQMPKTLLFPALSPTRCRFRRHFLGQANHKTRRPARQRGSASPPSRADKPAGPCGLMRAPYGQRYTC